MSDQTVQRASVRAPAPPLSGWLLVTAKAVWLAVAALTVGLFVLAAPLRFEELQAVCTGAACRSPQLSLDDIRMLQGLGLSRTAHAAYNLGLETLFAGVNFLIALIIFARRSNDRVALLVALMLMTFGPATFTGTMNALAARGTDWQLPAAFLSSLPGSPPDWLLQPLSPWRVPVGFVYAVGQVTFALFFLLFPDGQFVPRWGIVPAAIWSVWQVLAAFLPTTFLNSANWNQWLSIAVWLGFLGLFVFAQVYRYRRWSDPVQQQQTKWVVFGLSAAVGGFFLAVLLALNFSVLGLSSLLFRQTVQTVEYVAMLAMPIAFGVAIMRSRLWAIDIIINRTLVYGALTVLLGLFYLGIVFVLQFGFRTMTGQGQSSIVVAISTLAIAALFNPLRRRVQVDIDRRFYRRKYDAARVLAAFGTVMRDEVDLDRLANEFLAVVQDTIQPASISLWLKEPTDRRKLGQKR
jgi:hypothetical protein